MEMRQEHAVEGVSGVALERHVAPGAGAGVEEHALFARDHEQARARSLREREGPAGTAHEHVESVRELREGIRAHIGLDRALHQAEHLVGAAAQGEEREGHGGEHRHSARTVDTDHVVSSRTHVGMGKARGRLALSR